MRSNFYKVLSFHRKKGVMELRRLACLLFALVILVSPALASRDLTIVYINDTHGYVETFTDFEGNSLGGFARIATVVTELMEEHENVLFLHAGDLLTGPPMSRAFHGKVDVECLSVMGLDGCTLGNHEFDFGQENLRELIALAEFPFFSANVYIPEEEHTFTEEWFITPQLADFDLPVVVYGLTTEETPEATHPHNVEGLEFLSPTAVSCKLLEYWEEEYPVVIALAHMGRSVDGQLALEVGEIDLIVGGHSHDAIFEPDKFGDCPVVSAGCHGHYVGVIELTFDQEGRIEEYDNELISIDDGVAEDAVVAAIIKGYSDQIAEYNATVVGNSEVEFDGIREHVRSRETNLGDLAADIMRIKTGTNVAFINGGAIRDSLPAGPITIGDLLKAFPFENYIVTMELYGEQIVEALSTSLTVNMGEGGFLQMSGLTVVADSGGNIRGVTVGGEPLDEAALYSVAVPDFLAAGGDGYTVFTQGLDWVDTGYLVNDYFIEYMQEVGQLTEPEGDRIIIE